MEKVTVKAYCKKTHNLVGTKEMTIDEWNELKKVTKKFYYRAYQI